MRKGFTSVVESVDDTALDVPDAAELLALFIARAVVDDVLPPAFVAKWVGQERGRNQSRVTTQWTWSRAGGKLLKGMWAKACCIIMGGPGIFGRNVLVLVAVWRQHS